MLGAFLEPSADDWLAKAGAAWFGGGLAALLIAAMRTQIRAALVGFVVALMWDAAVLSPLFRNQAMVSFEAGVPEWVSVVVGDAGAYGLLSLFQRAVPISSVAAFLLAPHVAAFGALAIRDRSAIADPARERSRMRLLVVGLVFALVGWAAFYMPSNAFGVAVLRGSTFCRTTSGCEKNSCGDRCYGIAPLSEFDLIERCGDSRVRCECRYSRCDTVLERRPERP